MHSTMKLVIGLIAAAGFVPNAVNAAVTLNIAQVGSDVVATSSGSLDLTGLTDSGINFGSSTGGLNPAFANIVIGAPGFSLITGYSGFTGPTSFGPGAITVVPTAGTGGSYFGTNGGSSTLIFVPRGYASGGSLAASSTFSGQTFASLGLTAGSYLFRSAMDTVTVNVGSSRAVPEPATWAMMLSGFGVIGCMMRRRNKLSANIRLV